MAARSSDPSTAGHAAVDVVDAARTARVIGIAAGLVLALSLELVEPYMVAAAIAAPLLRGLGDRTGAPPALRGSARLLAGALEPLVPRLRTLSARPTPLRVIESARPVPVHLRSGSARAAAPIRASQGGTARLP